MLLDSVQTLCQQACGLKKDAPIVVGVSGGPDSLCLLDLFHRMDYRLVVAHANHQLRPSADEEAQRVGRLAQHLDLPFISEVLPVQALSDEGSIGLEEAARVLRYRFLFEQARFYGAQAVAVGHTADDQVETVLMHLLRGSGLNGLRGMNFRMINPAWDTQIALVRPLLATWREEILAYCSEQGLEAVWDESNQDQHYLRNRVRGELIPLLETYQPTMRQGVWRMARLLAGDDEILEGAAAGLWGQTAVVGEGYVRFSRPSFLECPLGLQRRLVRRAIRTLQSKLDNVDAFTVERVVNAMAVAPQTRQLDLALGLRMVFEGERVWLAHWTSELPGDEWPQLDPQALIRVDGQGELALGTWKLAIDEVDIAQVRQSARQPDHPFEAWIDADRANFPLQVRARRAGDRWQPLGLAEGSQKISDTMINARLPQRARRKWPLVCAGEEVIWVPGIRPAHTVRLTDETTRVVHLSLTAQAAN